MPPNLASTVRRNRLRMGVVALVAVAVWAAMLLPPAALLLFRLGTWIDGDSPPFAGLAPAGALAVVAAGIATGVSAWLGHRTALRQGRRLQPLPASETRVANIVAALAIAVDVIEPAVLLRDDPAPNAMAIGTRPETTRLIVTTGLVQELTRDELEAVIAAEMWAIRRYDTALQSVTVAATTGAIRMHCAVRFTWKDITSLGKSIVWRSVFVVITFPLNAIAEGLRRWVHHQADFGADALAAATTRYPDALRRALVKLRDDPRTVSGIDFSLAALWFEPIPHDDERRAMEFRAVSLTPSLDDRLSRLAV